ncbi:MAG: hypothetical protein IPH78_06600 [Bacteroidetes bacterium]|nr:hypothetical protein [Bacteroidota bacterium]MBK8658193.1 hypothetical protein [Bacteroidota bacterium]
MNRLLDFVTNTGKALELRLEDHGSRFFVVLQGAPVYISTGTAYDNDADPEECMLMPSSIYNCDWFSNYREARTLFNTLKEKVE